VERCWSGPAACQGPQAPIAFAWAAAWRDIAMVAPFRPPLARHGGRGRALACEACVTAGMLTDQQGRTAGLRGLHRLYHNLDTSPEFLRRITHAHLNQEPETLARVRRAGIDRLLAGGIIAWARATRPAGLLQCSPTRPHPRACRSMPCGGGGTPTEQQENRLDPLGSWCGWLATARS